MNLHEKLIKAVETGEPVIAEIKLCVHQDWKGDIPKRVFKITPSEAKKCIKNEIEGNRNYYIEEYGEKILDTSPNYD